MYIMQNRNNIHHWSKLGNSSASRRWRNGSDTLNLDSAWASAELFGLSFGRSRFGGDDAEAEASLFHKILQKSYVQESFSGWPVQFHDFSNCRFCRNRRSFCKIEKLRQKPKLLPKLPIRWFSTSRSFWFGRSTKNPLRGISEKWPWNRARMTHDSLNQLSILNPPFLMNREWAIHQIWWILLFEELIHE